MKFMLEFHLNPGTKRAVAEAFDLRGPNRAAGVSFQGAWIGTERRSGAGPRPRAG